MKVILVVTDDALMREIVGMLQEQLGISMLVAECFEGGKEILAEIVPDAVITDYRFAPEKETGLDVARLVQGRTPPIPVLLMTAVDITGDLLEQCKNVGIGTVLSKSMEVATLRRRIEQFIASATTKAEGAVQS